MEKENKETERERELKEISSNKIEKNVKTTEEGMRKTEICLVCFVLFYSIGLFNTGKFPKTVSYDQNTHSLQGNSLHRAPLSNVCPHQCIPLDTRPAEKLILRISPILQHFSKSHGFEK